MGIKQHVLLWTTVQVHLASLMTEPSWSSPFDMRVLKVVGSKVWCMLLPSEIVIQKHRVVSFVGSIGPKKPTKEDEDVQK